MEKRNLCVKQSPEGNDIEIGGYDGGRFKRILSLSREESIDLLKQLNKAIKDWKYQIPDLVD